MDLLVRNPGGVESPSFPALPKRDRQQGWKKDLKCIKNAQIMGPESEVIVFFSIRGFRSRWLKCFSKTPRKDFVGLPLN